MTKITAMCITLVALMSFATFCFADDMNPDPDEIIQQVVPTEDGSYPAPVQTETAPAPTQEPEVAPVPETAPEPPPAPAPEQEAVPVPTQPQDPDQS